MTLPRSGTSNQRIADRQDEHRVEHPDERVGQQLADDELPSAEGRHVQLLEGPELALADDRHRREVGGDHEEKQRQHARDHEVLALELRVEPHPHVRFETAGAAGARGQSAFRELACIAGDKTGGIPERDGGGVGIAAVCHDLHGRHIAGEHCAAVTRWDGQRHGDLPFSRYGSASLTVVTVSVIVK